MTRKSAAATAAKSAGEQGQLTQQMTDEEIVAAINAEMALQKSRQPTPRKISIKDLFDQSIALVAAATGKRFRDNVPAVSEQSAVKVLELTMMWALNNRDTSSGEVIPTEELGDQPEEPSGPETIHEVIGGDAAETE